MDQDQAVQNNQQNLLCLDCEVKSEVFTARQNFGFGQNQNICRYEIPVHPIKNPLLHAPISGSPNSAANKDMMSKIWRNEDTIT